MLEMGLIHKQLIKWRLWFFIQDTQALFNVFRPSKANSDLWYETILRRYLVSLLVC